MSYIVEVREDGLLAVPPELRDRVRPGNRYILEFGGESLLLRPLTPEANARSFREWAARQPKGRGLPDSAVGRDGIYD